MTGARPGAAARRRALAAVALVAIAAGSLPASAQPQDDEAARVEEAARRVLELRREAEALLASLSPALRPRVEARIAELSAERGVEPAADVAAELAQARGGHPCAGLAAFDRDGDGIVSAIDRAWRHLYLWRDDGDGEIAVAEVLSLFELGVRALDSSLRTYTTASGFVGDLEVGDGVSLDIPAPRRGGGFERGELVVDNDKLRRAGEPVVRREGAGELAGYQPLRRGYLLRLPEGAELSLPCG